MAVERRGDVKAVRCGAGCVGGGGVFRERVRVVGLSGSELFVPFELRGAKDEVAGFLRRLDRAELAGASRDGREGVAAADGYLRVRGDDAGERRSADVAVESKNKKESGHPSRIWGGHL